MAASAIALLRTLIFISTILAASVKSGRMRRPPHVRDSDLVVGLPGQPSVKFRHYAGYVSISDDKALFYWLYEAAKAPAKKPLVLLLGGGPGCSPIHLGGITPFNIKNDSSSLTSNPYTWNKAANLLFLDTPVGVGFSYSNKSLDLEKLNDQITAEDTYTFLIKWFKKFPMFKSHEFYITGYSYSGHYVPQAAELIHERNKIAMKNSYINLKGFMIGNPLLDWLVHYITVAEFAWNHGLISYKLYQTFINECPIPKDYSVESWNQSCEEALVAVDDSFNEIDWQHIYKPNCDISNSSKSDIMMVGLEKDAISYDPCAISSVDNMGAYLNRDDVQKALHANVTRLPYPFLVCSEKVNELYNKYEVSTVIPSIQKLVDVGYRIWIYSGDADGSVPFEETRKVVMSMNLTEKIWDEWGGWREWHYNGQVAGWMVEYIEGLTFISVRGAGHVVTGDAPGRSLSLFSHFLKGEPLPFNSTNIKA